MDVKAQKQLLVYEKRMRDALLLRQVQQEDIFLAGYERGYAEGEHDGARDAANEVRDRYAEAFQDGQRW